MAPFASWVAEAKRSLVEDGFFDLRDSVAGERFVDLENRQMHLATPYGIDFLKIIMWNLRIRAVLLHIYQKVTLGHTLFYNEKPSRIFSFSRGGPDTFLLPAVHIWSKGSVVEYWVGSQKHCLPILPNKEDQPQQPLLEYAESSMTEAGCERREFQFADGAMILVDARIAFTRTKNPMIFSIFFPDDLIAAPKMMLSQWSQERQDKVDDLQSENIKANFHFENRD